MSLETVARYLVFAGIGLLLIGGGILLLSRLGLAPGKLPGDFVFRWGNTTLAVPLGTSILISIVLTVLLNLVVRLFNK